MARTKNKHTRTRTHTHTHTQPAKHPTVVSPLSHWATLHTIPVHTRESRGRWQRWGEVVEAD